ncbi:DNA-binding transcriptional regulator YdaS (Cro superfamily) [Sphingomonas vulcanisoli]|uniref:DNA-binding transcriptional regulator YdaS (Cro superfamily) n=1 Tax=Sphingomonas vulcanisoli TaxID=1658060 RepID=A0ABX0TR57_9SPHN|nr:helix-turn-helix domain-containing protein [Sphingomonas vulcanisoli]NIJ07214.1 DNA-binding transcriptional regulator YdaS (Cro superfamily) [Sphingomonas vulcanisoli]
MDTVSDIFTRFGGTREMARQLDLSKSTVDSWKRARQIPAQHQPLLLKRAADLGVDITAEDVIFPFPQDRERAS